MEDIEKYPIAKNKVVYFDQEKKIEDYNETYQKKYTFNMLVI